MQEDKEAVFDAAETLDLMLAAMTGMAGDMRVNAAAMKKAAGWVPDGDGSRRLAGARGGPAVPRRAPRDGPRWRSPRSANAARQLPLEALKEIHPAITDAVYSVLSVANSVKSRTSYGGTAPAEVRKQIRAWRKRLAKG